MKPLTDQQKKWAWIAGAILLTAHFAPNFINSVHHASSSPAPAVLHKPSPARVAPAPPPPPPSREVIAAGKYGGIIFPIFSAAALPVFRSGLPPWARKDAFATSRSASAVSFAFSSTVRVEAGNTTRLRQTNARCSLL
jgi:hypothetical protein